MKFLLDAQLPPSLKRVFIEQGHDCIHTLDLPLANDTPDKAINAVSVAEQRIVVTKDSDFFDSFLLKNEPCKLVLVKLGNTSKAELIEFFRNRLDEIIERITTDSLVVLSKTVE